MKTRVLYLERDAALRGFMARLMEGSPSIALVGTYGAVSDLLAADLSPADVALFDADLGPLEIDGIELGLALRSKARLGIVLFTSVAIPELTETVPVSERRGWSVVSKSMVVDEELLLHTIEATARGLNVVDPAARRLLDAHPYRLRQRLTPRQRHIMSLAAQGLDGKSIAAETHLAAITVRQELSRAYSVLVPDARDGVDLRTLAVVRYLRSIPVGESLLPAFSGGTGSPQH